MKVTAGAHPDLPFPFSNGPEQPPPSPQGLPEPLRLATERHEQGVDAMAALVNAWLGRGNLSHDQLSTIAAWGLGERLLDKSVVSRIRNRNQERGVSWRHIDALAAANYAIWLWQTKGPDAARAELGPHSSWGFQDRWLNEAAWMPRVDDESQPLGFTDLCSLLAGYLDLPYLATAQLSPGDARKLSRALIELLEGLIADRSWVPRKAIHQLLEAYPVTDQARRRRLKSVIVGDETLSPAELESELHAIAEMIRATRGLKPGSYGPAELQRELSSGVRLRP